MPIHHSRSTDADTALRTLKVLGVLLLLLAMSGCFATHTSALSAEATPGVPGFWQGLWHGFIAPIAFVVFGVMTVLYSALKDLSLVLIIGVTGITLLGLGILAVIMHERITTLAERFSDWNA